MKRVNVLKDVGRLVGDEENVELFERLIDIADIRCFYRCVLRTRRYELRKRSKQRFYACPRHFSELTRDDRCTLRVRLFQ